eukprot:TRINITY_DN103_c0_g2_i1.p1 TRINITY_DN103_c0_g2~~TRINITY_DN103_c0_g2_i1.p1  ORF type:complete len:297 (-),score=76.87 TRINITY_DN103_c0_g2_i1:137-1027(-)
MKSLFNKKTSDSVKPRSDSKGVSSLQAVGRSSSESSFAPPTPKETYNIIFGEDTTLNEKYLQNQIPTAPESPANRSIWVMKLLHNVITKGGFLSPSLYLPKEIWYQYDIEIDALDIKLVAIEACSELLKGLGTKLPNQQDEEVVAKELSIIYGELESVAEKLSARVPSVKLPKTTVQKDASSGKKDKKKETKTSKSSTKMKAAIIAGLMEKYEKKQYQSIDNYRFQLDALLGNSARILENWVRYTDRMKGEVKELMKKISMFVEFALLPFILEDFSLLACSQLTNLQKSFCTVVNK